MICFRIKRLLFIGLGVVAGIILLVILHHRSAWRASVQELTLKAYFGDLNALATLRSDATKVMPEIARLTQFEVPAWRRFLRSKASWFPGRLRKFALGETLPNAFAIRKAAVRTLGLFGPEARKTAPALIAVLGDPETSLRLEAAQALGRVGADAVPALLPMLNVPDANARAGAIIALGEVGPPAITAIQVLLPGLTDPNPQVRSATQSTLPKLGPEAVLALVDVTAAGDNAAQQSAAVVLQRMVSSSKSPVATLREMATDPDPVKRARAVQALGKLRPVLAIGIKSIIAATEDKVLEVRLAAVEALGNTGAKGKAAISTLTPLAHSPDAQMREAARLAIEKIERAAAPETIPR